MPDKESIINPILQMRLLKGKKGSLSKKARLKKKTKKKIKQGHTYVPEAAVKPRFSDYQSSPSF